MGDGQGPLTASVDPRPSASQHAFDRGHWAQLPAELGEDPGRDKRGDEDCEPDANHVEHGITGQAARNRVFPSRRKSFRPEL